MTFVWWKALAALALAPLAFDGPRRALAAIASRYSTAAVVAMFAGSRLAACLLAFVVLRLPLPGDVSNYYTAFADIELGAGRHEGSPYSPGFDYLLGALRWWSGDMLSVILLMVVAEIAAFAFVMRLLDRHRPVLSRPLAVLWLVSPVSLLHVALGGQDEALILLAWAGVASLLLSGRAVAAGMAAVVGLASTKLLGLFAMLSLIGQPARPVRRTAGAAVLGVAMLMALLEVLRMPFGNLAGESRLVTSGNLWTLATIGLAGRRPEPLVATLVLTGAVLATAAIVMHWRPRATAIDQLLRVSGTMGCLFLLLSQKSFANYLVIFLPGVLYLALEAPALERAFVLGLVLPVSAFEPSLWFHLGGGEAPMHWMSGRLALLAADLTLVAGYVLVARRGLSAPPASPASWRVEAA